MNLQYLIYYPGGIIFYLLVRSSGSLLFALHYKRKPQFAGRYVLSLLAAMLLAVPLSILQYYIEMTYDNIILTNIYVFFFYMLLFAVWMLAMHWCYDEPFLHILVAGVLGGICQYLSNGLYSILNAATGLDTYLYLNFQQKGYFIGQSIQVCFAVAVLTLCYFLFVKRVVGLSFHDRQKSGLYLVAVLSQVMLSILNMLGNIFVSADRAAMVFVKGVLMLLAISIFVIHLEMLETQSTKRELAIVTKLNEAAQSHYAKLKENMELINIKCHDIKHYIAAAGAHNRAIGLEELNSLVTIYDTTVKTGNEVIDTLLAEYSLYCSVHDICLTVIADASGLNFISIADMCSLFGNLLENAVEAVEKVQDKSRRVINVNIRPIAGQMFFCVENHYEQAPIIRGYMPVSQKKGEGTHGFGVKSIKLIAEKYNGVFSCHAEDGVFHISILFPSVQG